jgi:D-arabinose 1-dehydrogenase-like Zn-dependent alcohol dehydrogenase
MGGDLGIGGLGHYGVPIRQGNGHARRRRRCASEKLELAKSLGAEIALNAQAGDVAAEMQKLTRGAHGALVTAVSPKAFEQAFDMLRSRGTMALVGLPPGKMSLPIFNMVLKRITVRGSIVGTRQDLEEALASPAAEPYPHTSPGTSWTHQRHLRAHGRGQDRWRASSRTCNDGPDDEAHSHE